GAGDAAVARHAGPADTAAGTRARSYPAAVAALGVPLQRQLDQPGNQLPEGQSARLPEDGIHADLGEARDGIDLVDVDGAGVSLEAEVHARHPGRVHDLESAHRHLAHRVGLRLRVRRRDEQIRALIDVLGRVVVERVDRPDVTL